MFHDFAKKKVQTGVTFRRLLTEIDRRLQSTRSQLGLPSAFPCIIIMDNVSSHSKELFEDTGVSPWLQQCTLFPNIYAYFGIAGLFITTMPCCFPSLVTGLSHLSNPGDQFVNTHIRSHIRRQSKLRVVHFHLSKNRGLLPPSARLEMGEPYYKPLVVQWVSEWVATGGHLQQLIKKSFDRVLKAGTLEPVPAEEAEEQFEVEDEGVTRFGSEVKIVMYFPPQSPCLAMLMVKTWNQMTAPVTLRMPV